MERISRHISYEEAVHSAKAIKLKLDNTPNNEQLSNMRLVAEKCFEPVRDWYGKPLKINSFFRSNAVNKAVKGSLTSDHLKGGSIDIDAGSVAENRKIFNWIKKNLTFDQLIFENNGEWVHVSYRAKGNRNEVLNLKQVVA